MNKERITVSKKKIKLFWIQSPKWFIRTSFMMSQIFYSAEKMRGRRRGAITCLPAVISEINLGFDSLKPVCQMVKLKNLVVFLDWAEIISKYLGENTSTKQGLNERWRDGLGWNPREGLNEHHIFDGLEVLPRRAGNPSLGRNPNKFLPLGD
jgi:hypothetical protein